MLTTRQAAFYTDTVDVYKRPDPTARSTATPWLTDLTMSATATYTSVPCLWLSQPENNMPGAFGRSEQDNLLTLDRFHFEVGTDLEDGDYLKLTTSGHPAQNSFFQVQGTGRERITRGKRKGNYMRIYAKRTTDLPVSS